MAKPNIEHVVTSQYGIKFFESTRESAEDMLAHGCIFSHLEWPSYTCPGGYPTYYTTKDGGCLCSVCANENLYLTLDGDDQWRIVDQDINWEDSHLYCDNCGEHIEPAYQRRMTMTTLHVSLLIDFAKEVGEKNEDRGRAASAFVCYLIGHISAYDRAQANALANALHFEHVMRALNEDAKT